MNKYFFLFFLICGFVVWVGYDEWFDSKPDSQVIVLQSFDLANLVDVFPANEKGEIMIPEGTLLIKNSVNPPNSFVGI